MKFILTWREKKGSAYATFSDLLPLNSRTHKPALHYLTGLGSSCGRILQANRVIQVQSDTKWAVHHLFLHQTLKRPLGLQRPKEAHWMNSYIVTPQGRCPFQVHLSSLIGLVEGSGLEQILLLILQCCLDGHYLQWRQTSCSDGHGLIHKRI